RRCHRLRATAGVDDVGELRAAAREEQPAQLLERLTGEQVAVAARNLVELRGDRRVHLAVAVTDAERGRAARAVEIATPVGVVEIAPLASHDARQHAHSPARGAT